MNSLVEVQPSFDPTELQKSGLRARLGARASDYIPLFYPLIRLLPNLRLGKFVVVARRDDVEEVLANTQVFNVRSGKRLSQLLTKGGKATAFTPAFGQDKLTAQQATMKIAARVLHLQDTVSAAMEVAQIVIEQSAPISGSLDFGELVLITTAEFAKSYFGLVGPIEARTLSLCCHALVDYAFGVSKLDSPGGRVGIQAAAYISDVVRRSIYLQKHSPDTATIIGRLRRNGVSDALIESLVIVMMMAQVAVPAVASMNAVRFLLRRPDAMFAAREAALADDDVALGQCLMEALRFNYIAPAQLRDCNLATKTAKTRIAGGTWRQIRVRQGDVVLAMLHSAMFDGRRVHEPRKFDPKRDVADNLIFGFGMHRCAGSALGRTLLVHILKPLLKRGIRQTAADRARIEFFGAFRQSFPVELG